MFEKITSFITKKKENKMQMAPVKRAWPGTVFGKEQSLRF